jgi:hypothetical protein
LDANKTDFNPCPKSLIAASDFRFATCSVTDYHRFNGLTGLEEISNYSSVVLFFASNPSEVCHETGSSPGVCSCARHDHSRMQKQDFHAAFPCEQNIDRRQKCRSRRKGLDPDPNSSNEDYTNACYN